MEIRLDFRFQVKHGPEGELLLVLECPEKYDVLLNGQTVSNQPQGYYRDKALGMLPLDGRLREGENLLQLKTLFRQTPEVYENLKKSLLFESEKNKLSYLDEIEAVYLVGNFGLETSNGCFQQFRAPGSSLQRRLCSDACAANRIRGQPGGAGFSLL